MGVIRRNLVIMSLLTIRTREIPLYLNDEVIEDETVDARGRVFPESYNRAEDTGGRTSCFSKYETDGLVLAYSCVCDGRSDEGRG